jgi:hypothetical protein
LRAAITPTMLLAATAYPVHSEDAPGIRLTSSDGQPCTVQLAGPRGDEWAVPCGKPVTPTVPGMRAWLQTATGSMSGQVGLADILPNSLVVLPLEAGGMVLVHRPPECPDCAALLIQLEGGFVRIAPGARLDQPVAMPVGTIVVAILGQEVGQCIAIARPIQLRRSQTVEVAPEPPGEGRVDLLVRLRRPAGRRKDESMASVLATSAAVTPPAVSGFGDLDFVAAWYGVEGRHATLQLESSRFRIARPEVALVGSGAVLFDTELTQLPELAVNLELPSSLSGPVAVSVRRGTLTLAERTVPVETRQLKFVDVPAAQLDIWLTAPPWQWAEAVDLTDGRDASVDFAPVAIHAHGRVFLGEKPTAARVEFRSSPGSHYAEADADEDGKYSIDVFADYQLVLVYVPASDTPYTYTLHEPLSSTESLDFHLPNTFLDVKVVEAQSGKPIADATVGFYERQERSGRTMAVLPVSSDGTIRIGPLNKAKLLVKAKAPGYEPARRELDVGEENPDPVEFRLERQGDIIEVSVLLADGRPGAGATLAVFLDNDGPMLWTGEADQGGKASVPRRECCLLAVRHAAGAGQMASWPPSGGLGALGLQLGPAARPLVVQAQVKGQPARWPRLRFWLNGERIGSSVAEFLYGAAWATTVQGTWTLSGLPALPIDLLCWEPKPLVESRARNGDLDGLRTHVVWPWPQVVVVETVE